VIVDGASDNQDAGFSKTDLACLIMGSVETYFHTLASYKFYTPVLVGVYSDSESEKIRKIAISSRQSKYSVQDVSKPRTVSIGVVKDRMRIFFIPDIVIVHGPHDDDLAEMPEAMT
jgi:hypothetical protein